ncbi:HDOD domain-containing protein [Pontibacterium sp. N1Y112]|uniref:HDOD domain-containing protein n=1 Tax=Pontibacterium sinense TaxID=2781979 RepID=A0A8J7K5Y1_9GAMM|nr:HDOD domain-containing protein [Pontibacterium sinense]
MTPDKPKVLFLDDESSALRSLHRNLRRHFRDWELVFEQCPEDALRQLDTLSPWVVVSDKRMPRMDGIEFLGHVRQQCPLAVRILLSGETDTDKAVPAVGVAHLMLPKPFEMEGLIDALHAAQCLRELPIPLHLREQIGCIDSLPVLPAVYKALVSYLNQTDEPDSERIAEIITQDTAILSKILQLANSAFFGFATPATSAIDAVVRLGQGMIKNLVLCAGIFRQDSSNNTYEHEQLCRQAEHVAGIMRTLSQEMKLSRAEADHHYVLGMLHNVGGLISGETGNSERNAVISAYLLKLWGFDSDTVVAVLYQLHPENAHKIKPMTLRLHASTVINHAHQIGGDPLAADSGLNQSLLRDAGMLEQVEQYLQADTANQ